MHARENTIIVVLINDIKRKSMFHQEKGLGNEKRGRISEKFENDFTVHKLLRSEREGVISEPSFLVF